MQSQNLKNEILTIRTLPVVPYIRPEGQAPRPLEAFLSY